jgi:cell division protein FtsL
MAFRFHYFICALAVGFCIYLYIDARNDLTELKLAIPEVEKQLKELKELNRQLSFEIARFESPQHLMELARKTEFSHLKPSFEKDYLVIPLEANP